MISDVNYRVQQGRRKIVVHYNNIKPYYTRPDNAIPSNTAESLERTENRRCADHLDEKADECLRFDAEFERCDEEEEDNNPQPAANEADEGIIHDQARRSPIMRNGGRLWCNVDPENMLPYDRAGSSHRA